MKNNTAPKYDQQVLYDIFMSEIVKTDPITMLQLWARIRWGLHLREIADRTTMSPEAVRRRIKKVTTRVRRRYEEEISRDRPGNQ